MLKISQNKNWTYMDQKEKEIFGVLAIHNKTFFVKCFLYILKLKILSYTRNCIISTQTWYRSNASSALNLVR